MIQAVVPNKIQVLKSLMASSEFTVLVIGGGSCGLVLAQGLQKHGISYTLFERDSQANFQHRPRDWGSLLHWGKKYVEKCLPPELWERRSEMYVDPYYDYDSNSSSLVWDGVTGNEIKRPESLEGAVRVSRGKIRKLLSQGLNIEYGKRLEKIVHNGDTVEAHFEDGSMATGSLLLGCDGGHSKTREHIVGLPAANGFDTGYTMMNTWARIPAETALALRAKHPIISQAVNTKTGRGNLIAILDVPAKDAPPETWKFQVYTGWKGGPSKADLDTPEKALLHFKTTLEAQAEPFKSVSKAFKDGDVVPIDVGWNFKPEGDFDWNNHAGRVTIAGDAAHSMLPHRGQGLNNAVCDAANLVDAVLKMLHGKQSIVEAIEAYENEMRPRGAKEVELTYQQMVFTAEGRFSESALSKIGFNRE